MRSFYSRLLLTLGLIAGLAACQSGLPTSSEPDLPRPPSPDPLLEPLPGTDGQEPVTLIRVRGGETLTPDDARLTVIDGSLSLPAVIDKTVDGRGFVAFRLAPDGLDLMPFAVLAISVDKADLRGVDPSKLKVAVASDERDDWRVVGGIYEPNTRTVFAPVLHFSRYALCVD